MKFSCVLFSVTPGFPMKKSHSTTLSCLAPSKVGNEVYRLKFMYLWRYRYPQRILVYLLAMILTAADHIWSQFLRQISWNSRHGVSWGEPHHSSLLWSWAGSHCLSLNCRVLKKDTQWQPYLLLLGLQKPLVFPTLRTNITKSSTNLNCRP